MGPRRHRRVRTLAWALGGSLLLIAAYYLAPVEPDAAGGALLWRLSLALVAVAVLGAVILRLARRLAREESGAVPASLLLALVGGVVLFAFVDYLLAVSRPAEFVGISTKTDALYFAVSTLATVGYGDVHASGQLARAVVAAQITFNLTILATGGAVLVRTLPTGPRPGPAQPP